MAASAEHYNRYQKEHRLPLRSYTELKNINSLDHPQNTFLNLTPIAIGEGYLMNNTVYREAVDKLKEEGKVMDPQTYAGHVELVAEQMAEDKFARSGDVLTFCELAMDEPHVGTDMAVTGRMTWNQLETKELVKPVIEDEAVELEEILPKKGKIFELGRIVAVEAFRGTRLDGTNQTTELIKNFIDGPNGIVDVAQRLGFDTMITIAKEQFAKHTHETSMPLIEGVDYKLTPKGLAVAQSYDGYWGKDNPKIYVTKVPPIY